MVLIFTALDNNTAVKMSKCQMSGNNWSISDFRTGNKVKQLPLFRKSTYYWPSQKIPAYFILTCDNSTSYSTNYEGKCLPKYDAIWYGRNLLPSHQNVRRHLPDYAASYSRKPYSENQGVLVIRTGNSVAWYSLAKETISYEI